MAVYLSPVGGAGAQFFSNNGVPLSGGKLHTYLAGTTTAQATYTTSAGNVAHANPIVFDSAGRVSSGGEIWLTQNIVYKFVLKDANDVLIATYDNISGINNLDADQVPFTGFENQSGNVQNLADDDGSSYIGFLQAGTGAIAISAQEKMRETVSVKDFDAVGDGVTNDTAAIQAAIDYAETLNGGVVQVPKGIYKITSTLQMDASIGVQLIGQGSDGIHDGGTGAAAATTLSWYGSSGGTFINVSSPSGASNARQYGSSISDIKLDCRSTAGIGLLVNSARNCTFSRIFIVSPTIAGVKTTTLGNASLAESSDTQRCVFDRVSVRAIDDASTRPAHGLWLTSHSPVGSNSNTSLNYFSQCDMQMWGGTGSGYGLFLEDGDNNTFMNLRVSRASTTTVEAVRIVGNTSCDANYFWNLSAGGANSITIKGTASGFVINPRKNSFWCTDSGNGTQLPTVDSGVIYFWHNDDNVLKQTMFNQAIIADSQAQALGNYGNIGNGSVYVFNGSNNHILLADGTNLWGVNLDSATGDLRLLRLVGSGAVNVGDGAPVKILGKNVTEGAIDSGGVGFKVLRVPN